MQIEHKTEKGTVLFIKLTEDVISITEVIKKSLWYRHEVGFSYINLPSEGFNLVGLTSEVTEEQAKMMVDSKIYKAKQVYLNYIDSAMIDSGKGSFKSLMQHLQVYEANPYEYPIYHNYNSDVKWKESNTKWQEAESRTGKWIVLFKPND